MNYLLQIFAYTRYFSDYGPNLLVSDERVKKKPFNLNQLFQIKQMN